MSHYLLGFHNLSYSGGGQGSRGTLFANYAVWLYHKTSGLFDMSLREAWAEANEIVESPDVEWAYLCATGSESDRVFYAARGSC